MGVSVIKNVSTLRQPGVLWALGLRDVFSVLRKLILGWGEGARNKVMATKCQNTQVPTSIPRSCAKELTNLSEPLFLYQRKEANHGPLFTEAL